MIKQVSYLKLFTGIRQSLQKITHDINWATCYLEKFKHKLKPEVRESNYNFSMAILSFYGKQYEQALEFLSIVKYEDYYFKYQLDSLLLKIYYELGNIESAYSLIDSNSHYVANNPNIPDSIRIYFKNFLIYYRKLLTLKLNQIPSKQKN